MTPHKFLQGNRETETQIQSLKRKMLKILFEINLVLATRAKPRRNTAFDGENSGWKAQDCVEMGYEQMDWG